MAENPNSCTGTVFVRFVERPAIKLVLKRGQKAESYFECFEEVGYGIWDILSGIKEAVYEPTGMWLPGKMIKPVRHYMFRGLKCPWTIPQTFPRDLR